MSLSTKTSVKNALAPFYRHTTILLHWLCGIPKSIMLTLEKLVKIFLRDSGWLNQKYILRCKLSL